MRSKTLLVLCSLILIAAAWIFLSRSMRLGDLDSAIGTMRTLVAIETKYAQTHQEIGYTCSLSALPGDELTAGLVKNERRNGYEFKISGCLVGDTKRPNTKYRLTARPLLSGMPAICSDESGVLKYDESGSIQRCVESGVPM